MNKALLMDNSILVLYAHPAPLRSNVNKPMFEIAMSSKAVEGRDLYELYPDLHIDVAAEQEALRRHKAVVFQFPLYWYNTPALLKEWQDTVLTSGFAHGSGKALAGKIFMIAVTTGGTAESYAAEQQHGMPLSAYLAPLEQTARFCGMRIVKPFIVQGVGSLEPESVAHITQEYQNRLMELGA